MTNRQFSCCRKLFLFALRDLPNLIQLDSLATFRIMACILEWKAAPFGCRPQPMKFKMTNAVIAADALKVEILLHDDFGRPDGQVTGDSDEKRVRETAHGWSHTLRLQHPVDPSTNNV